MIYEETPQGIQRRVKRKRPGTLGVCALIQNKYHIDAVPHVLCRGFTREETEDFLIELSYLGIDNVLAVRGDDSGYQKPLQHGRSANLYAGRPGPPDRRHEPWQVPGPGPARRRALGLLRRRRRLSREALRGAQPAADARHVKEKIEAGADYVVTQMFFDNRHYFGYLDVCREAGIEAPVIPGLKILTSQKQLTTIPQELLRGDPGRPRGRRLSAKPEQSLDVGVEWALHQSRGAARQAASPRSTSTSCRAPWPSRS